MKTLSEVQNEIYALIKEGIEFKGVKKVENRNRKKLSILMQILFGINPFNRIY